MTRENGGGAAMKYMVTGKTDVGVSFEVASFEGAFGK